MLKRLLVIVFVFATLFAKGQVNLVPNGSFEVLDTCPFADSKINFCKPWFSPSTGTPDLYNSCAGTNGSWTSVPDNSFGYQYAYQGDGYAGIGIYVPTNVPSREYLGVKLSRELTINKYYCFTMYCSIFEAAYELNITSPGSLSEYSSPNIGVYFSPDSIFENNFGTLPYTPQIQNPTTNKIVGYDSWVKVEGIYKATDKDNYIYIGNFFDNANTILDTIFAGQNPEAWVYFYIDNVSLVECDGVGIEENMAGQIKIYPNPANEILNVDIGKLSQADIEIFDIAGRQILQQRLSQSTQTIDISALSSGVYVAAVYNDGRIVKRQKVLVVR